MTHLNTRDSYYVFFASAEESERGISHKSVRYETFADAKDATKFIKADHILIERHAEYWDGYYHEWALDRNRGGATALGDW
jgi:hypothetical protein